MQEPRQKPKPKPKQGKIKMDGPRYALLKKSSRFTRHASVESRGNDGDKAEAEAEANPKAEAGPRAEAKLLQLPVKNCLKAE